VYNDEEDTRIYDVVMNHEEQYSIWLKSKPVPAGWTAVGKSGMKDECLKYIDEVWTDMRPLSLRKHMAAFEAQQRAAAAGKPSDEATSIPHSVETLPGSVTTPAITDRPISPELR
jgi:MbtH protein